MAKGQQRDPKREEHWRRVLARFRKCGLSVRAFCRREKVTEPSFYAWRRTIRERDAAKQTGLKRRTERPAFLPVVVRGERLGDSGGGAGVTVELRGGRVLRCPGEITGERLAELVRALEAVPAEGRL